MPSVRPPLVLVLLLLFAQSGFSQALQTPNEFLPHRLGEQFTPHHLQVDYFQYLAANAPANMRLQQYGRSNEARPLQIAIFSSPENLGRLEAIRENNLRMAGMLDGKPDLNNPVVIVWLSMSVHGNEASGSECSMELAWRLATQNDPNLREWLKNTVVVLDPSLNPDGYDRYTHWNRMVGNLQNTPERNSREHQEPWPSGRTNHYHFDLNRDWAWASQTETRQRVTLYQRWLPQVHADLHEQSINSPYYFAPAAEPTHKYISNWQRRFQVDIGRNHARYFDEKGWLYFTKEVFDLLYPSYGDTYPMFNGAIGMTYEQAGNSSAGVAVLKEGGDTLTLYDRIQHHLTTSLSTIEVCSKNADKIVQNFREYYEKSLQQPQGEYKSFVIRENNDPNTVNKLCELLQLHGIRVGRVGAGLSGVKAFDYATGKESSVSLNPNDVLISAYQPKSTFVQALFEPEPFLSDSLTYDITAWALPFAYGLDAYAIKEKIEAKKPYTPWVAPEARVAAPPYAWCVHRGGFAENIFLGKLLPQGLMVRYATKPFDMSDQHFTEGALIIMRGDNRAHAADLDKIVQQAAKESNVELHPIFSGYANSGPDFGSSAYDFVRKPQIAIIYGEEADDNAYGHLWFYLERELKFPFSAISSGKINKGDLLRYNTLIFASGNYNLSERQLNDLRDWVRQGGRLIALEDAVKTFADAFEMKTKSESMPKEDDHFVPYASLERSRISSQLPGAIVKARVDNTHPLGFGLNTQYFSLKTSADVYELPSRAKASIFLESNYTSYGFIGSKIKPRLQNTPLVGAIKSGRGDFVYFVDSPVFRSFWHSGKALLANAIFF